ncbi:MAG: hypothetical protein ACREV5_09955 [Steroidobacter sp.]
MRTPTLVVLVALAGWMPSASIADTPETSAARPAATSTDAEPETAKAAETAKEKRAFKPPAGFKARIHDWGVVYCRKMPVLGSRFPKQVCMSEAQLKEHMAANDSMRRDKDQASSMCGGSCNTQ